MPDSLKSRQTECEQLVPCQPVSRADSAWEQRGCSSLSHLLVLEGHAVDCAQVRAGCAHLAGAPQLKQPCQAAELMPSWLPRS